MKVNELMIGDWVQQHNGKPVKVHALNVSDGYAITEDQVSVELTKDTCMGIDAKRLEPIPLTPEILEKNGYVHDKLAELALIAEGATWDTYVLMSDDHRIMINNASHNINSLNKWFVHVDTEDMCSMAGFEITHVHEFQHALKLCSIEKEIMI